ncbi:dipeptide ABC transporter ATP-binding protein [Microbacterium testaceum]|uniref:dipeptide ABC transporter ATP-binding protein n=1 Tax=Microbacterium testaceum TaxID=2033 RepID=UPI000733FE9D|nr:ABC transporter ATP-binding protein [Microbacterium testaceum]KTS05726.1 ABC transporter ATP-binding protein [Microbacterium testaceum]
MTTTLPVRSEAHTATALLAVEGLSVAYGRTPVVHDVSFAIPRGGSLALIGESGSGKSTIARSILRLLPRGAATARGRIAFDGGDLLGLSEARFRPFGGRRIGFVPQDPSHALNPVRTVGSQAHEAAALAGLTDARAQRAAILDVFARVGLPDPARVYGAYPHQLSGGMLQRVLIGLAVLPRPDLLVADEPTSALDVTIQKRILDLLDDLREDLGIGLLLVTHDLAIAAERTDEIVVLKDGRVQEAGATREVFAAPTSPYTVQLQADAPALNPDRYRRDVDERGVDAWTTDTTATRIDVREVSKSFVVDGVARPAVSGVSFRVPPGTTHALVGESGSGKTTTVRLLLGLESPDTGEILVDGVAVSGRTPAELRGIRRHLQLVYQNPFTSLDPTWSVGSIVREPLDQYRIGTRAERAARVAEALDAVGLPPHLARRRPAELSGGQRQRVAIARVLVLEPDVIVLDEPTSALDVTVQAGVFDVLRRLQRERGLTYLFVSHDLALVRQIADTVSVLKDGRVVEAGRVADVLSHPREEYTRALVDAIPFRDPRSSR